MNQRERQELDRHITGNYGEDRLIGEAELEGLIETAQVMYDLIQQWRESGAAPNFADLTAAHEQLGEALRKYED